MDKITSTLKRIGLQKITIDEFLKSVKTKKPLSQSTISKLFTDLSLCELCVMAKSNCEACKASGFRQFRCHETQEAIDAGNVKL